MDSLSSIAYSLGAYLVIAPAALSGFALVASQIYRYRYSTRLRLFSIPMCIGIGALTAGPLLFYIFFISPCASLNEVALALAFIAVTIVATFFVAICNTNSPAHTQVWTILISSLILACALWLGLFLILAFNIIGEGIQMSGGARQGCF